MVVYYLMQEASDVLVHCAHIRCNIAQDKCEHAEVSSCWQQRYVQHTRQGSSVGPLGQFQLQSMSQAL